MSISLGAGFPASGDIASVGSTPDSCWLTLDCVALEFITLDIVPSFRIMSDIFRNRLYQPRLLGASSALRRTEHSPDGTCSVNKSLQIIGLKHLRKQRDAVPRIPFWHASPRCQKVELGSPAKKQDSR
jgi:hypothetical protein